MKKLMIYQLLFIQITINKFYEKIEYIKIIKVLVLSLLKNK